VTRDPNNLARFAQRGFSLPTAIFLLVVLLLLGAFVVSITGTQQSALALDVQGVRAYQAARAGIEWAAYHALDPNNVLNPSTCSPAPQMPSCPPDTNLPPLAGSLEPFTVTVTCATTATTEGNHEVRVFRVVATACNQPQVGNCPNSAPATGYVERRLEAVLSKCRDSTASPPRCACG